MLDAAIGAGVACHASAGTATDAGTYCSWCCLQGLRLMQLVLALQLFLVLQLVLVLS